MAEHLLKNWIVYVMLGGFIGFVIFLVIHSSRDEEKSKK